VKEVLPGPLPWCTIKIGFGGGAVVGAFGFFLDAFLSCFSLGSFVLAVEASSLVSCLATIAPWFP